MAEADNSQQTTTRRKSLREQRREMGERFGQTRTGPVLVEEVVFAHRQSGRLFDDVYLHSARDMTQIKDAISAMNAEDEKVVEVRNQLEATLKNAKIAFERRVAATLQTLSDSGLSSQAEVRNPVTVKADIWHPACRRIIELFKLCDKELSQLQVLWLGEVITDEQHTERSNQLRSDLLATLVALTGIRNRVFVLRDRTPETPSAPVDDVEDVVADSPHDELQPDAVLAA